MKKKPLVNSSDMTQITFSQKSPNLYLPKKTSDNKPNLEMISLHLVEFLIQIYT